MFNEARIPEDAPWRFRSVGRNDTEIRGGMNDERKSGQLFPVCARCLPVELSNGNGLLDDDSSPDRNTIPISLFLSEMTLDTLSKRLCDKSDTKTRSRDEISR